MSTYWGLIKSNPAFRVVYSREIISNFGESFSDIANTSLFLSFWDSSLAIGAYYAAQNLLLILLSIFSGSIIDRFSNVKIILSVDSLAIFLDMILIYSNVSRVPWLFILAQALFVIEKALSHPAMDSFFPQIVQKEDIPTANTMTETTEGFLRILGIGLGGFATTYFGITGNYLMDMLTYGLCVAVLSTFLWRKDKFTFYEQSKAEKFNLNLSFIFSSKVIFLILINAWFYLTMASFNVLNVMLAKQFFQGLDPDANQDHKNTVSLGDSDGDGDGGDGGGISLPLAICYSVASLGSIIAPIVGNYFLHQQYLVNIRTRYVLGAGMGLMTLGSFFMIFTPRFGKETTWLIANFLFDGGINVLRVFMKSIFQTEVESQYVGRTFSIALSIRTLLSAVGHLTTGAILLNSDGTYVFIFLTIINLLVTLIWIFWYIPRYIKAHTQRTFKTLLWDDEEDEYADLGGDSFADFIDEA